MTNDTHTEPELHANTSVYVAPAQAVAILEGAYAAERAQTIARIVEYIEGERDRYAAAYVDAENDSVEETMADGAADALNGVLNELADWS